MTRGVDRHNSRQPEVPLEFGADERRNHSPGSFGIVLKLNKLKTLGKTRVIFAPLTGIDMNLDVKALVLLQLIQSVAELLDVLVFSGVG